MSAILDHTFSPVDSSSPTEALEFSFYEAEEQNKTFILTAPIEDQRAVILPLEEQKKSQHKCDTCTKAFSRAYHLKTHKLTHLQSKILKCAVCGEGFNHKHSLAEHKLKHSGIKPFRCNVCHKEFIRNRNLKQHQKVHV